MILAQNLISACYLARFTRRFLQQSSHPLTAPFFPISNPTHAAIPIPSANLSLLQIMLECAEDRRLMVFDSLEVLVELQDDTMSEHDEVGTKLEHTPSATRQMTSRGAKTLKVSVQGFASSFN